MPTLQQLIKKGRIKKPVHSKSPALNRCPQKKGLCLKVYKRKPKKPNSANRSVADLVFWTTDGRTRSIWRNKKRIRVIGFIPGEGHLIQQHSIVLLRGGRAKDLPGVRYRLIGGALDFRNTKVRRNKRSKYGVRSPKAAANK